MNCPGACSSSPKRHSYRGDDVLRPAEFVRASSPWGKGRGGGCFTACLRASAAFTQDDAHVAARWWNQVGPRGRLDFASERTRSRALGFDGKFRVGASRDGGREEVDRPTTSSGGEGGAEGPALRGWLGAGESAGADYGDVQFPGEGHRLRPEKIGLHITGNARVVLGQCGTLPARPSRCREPRRRLVYTGGRQRRASGGDDPPRYFSVRLGSAFVFFGILDFEALRGRFPSLGWRAVAGVVCSGR